MQPVQVCMASMLKDYKTELEDILVADKQVGARHGWRSQSLCYASHVTARMGMYGTKSVCMDRCVAQDMACNHVRLSDLGRCLMEQPLVLSIVCNWLLDPSLSP